MGKRLRPCSPCLEWVRCFAGNPSLRLPFVSGSWMFSWCPPCPFELFPVSIVSMCKSPCHSYPTPSLPHFRAAHSECPVLSLFGCIALCNSVGLPLSGLFFFLDSCRLFIVVPKACRCGVKYIVQIPVSSASLMLELSPLTLCWPLMLMCILLCLFLSLFFLSFPPFCAAKIGFARTTAEGKIFKLHLNIKKIYFSRTS